LNFSIIFSSFELQSILNGDKQDLDKNIKLLHYSK